jgi:hypothetical protein
MKYLILEGTKGGKSFCTLPEGTGGKPDVNHPLYPDRASLYKI